VGSGGGALESSAIIDNLWSRELARDPALLLLDPLFEWRAGGKLGEPTKSIDMMSLRWVHEAEVYSAGWSNVLGWCVEVDDKGWKLKGEGDDHDEMISARSWKPSWLLIEANSTKELNIFFLDERLKELVGWFREWWGAPSLVRT